MMLASGRAKKARSISFSMTLTANEDAVQLLGELGHQASRSLGAGHDNGLRLGGNDAVARPMPQVDARDG